MTDFIATAAANNGRQVLDAAYLTVLANRPRFDHLGQPDHACTSLCTADCPLA